MGMAEPEYYQELEELSYEEQFDEIEYSKIKLCLVLAIATFLLSGMIYFLSGNKIFAGIPIILVAGSLCFYNTSFGFMVLFFVPILEEWFVIIRGQSVASGLSLSKVIAVIIVVSYLLTRFGRGMKFPKPLKLVFVISLFMLFSSIWSPYFAYSCSRAFTTLLYACLIFVFFNTIEGAKCLRLMLLSLLGGNILVSLLLAVGKGVHTGAGHLSQWGGVVASKSDEGRLAFAEGGVGANVIAIFLAFAVMLGFYFFMKSKFFFRICIIVAELLLLFVLIKTESRSGLIYVVLVPLATFMLASRRGYRLKTFLGIMFLLILTSGLFYSIMKLDILPVKAKERMETSMENTTLTGRTDIWQGGKYLFLERPLYGWGWGSFPLKYYGRSAHSNIVMVAVELGIVGLALFGLLFVWLLIGCLRISDYSTKWLALMCLMWMFITGMLMTSMSTRVWWYLLAVVMKLIFIGRSGLPVGVPIEKDYDMYGEPTGCGFD